LIGRCAGRRAGQWLQAGFNDHTPSQTIRSVTNGWFIAPPTIGDSGTDYQIRAIIARIGLTANAPNQAVCFAGKGMLDSDGIV
jgi:hypothetical protein